MSLIITDDTGREKSDRDIAWMRETQRLRNLHAHGDLDDHAEPIEGGCQATYSVADGTAAGWNGPLGDYVRCELSRGHVGDHRYVVEWDDTERDELDWRLEDAT